MRPRSFKKSRKTRKVILVICEGETEKNYVELLKHHYRLPITIKSKVVGNKITKRLIKQYIKELNVESEEEVIIFFMYDMDVEEIIEKLKELNGTAILSNPCIELWFLLHHIDQRREISSNELLKKLTCTTREWKSYIKGTFNSRQSEILLSHRNLASQRAKMMDWPKNPSTNMHLFLESLENEKIT